MHLDLGPALDTAAMASQEEVGPKAMPGKKEVEIPECPVHSVVVYPDRAEVSCAGLAAGEFNTR